MKNELFLDRVRLKTKMTCEEYIKSGGGKRSDLKNLKTIIKNLQNKVDNINTSC